MVGLINLTVLKVNTLFQKKRRRWCMVGDLSKSPTVDRAFTLHRFWNFFSRFMKHITFKCYHFFWLLFSYFSFVLDFHKPFFFTTNLYSHIWFLLLFSAWFLDLFFSLMTLMSNVYPILMSFWTFDLAILTFGF